MCAREPWRSDALQRGDGALITALTRRYSLVRQDVRHLLLSGYELAVAFGSCPGIARRSSGCLQFWRASDGTDGGACIRDYRGCIPDYQPGDHLFLRRSLAGASGSLDQSDASSLAPGKSGAG